MLKKVFLFLLSALVFALVVGFFLLKFSKIPEPFPSGSQSAYWSESGDYEVVTKDFSLRDETRETQAHAFFTQFDGLPYRQFEATVWSPKNPGNKQYPLIVYSHGFMSERSDVQYLLQHLSSRGYIVLAVDYPLTSRASGDAILMADVVNQPADVSFLIDQITNPDTDIGKTFSHFIDENKIGLMGYSLGGLTSTLAAYHPSHRDPRVKAVVALAGPSAMLDKAFYQTNGIPFMMVAGTSDEVVPYDHHAAIISERVDNSVLVTIDAGSHMGFAGMAAILRWTNNPDHITCSLMNMKMESMGINRGKDEKAWYPLIGTTEQGVIYDDASFACDPDGIKRGAINPLRQHMLVKVATVSFFESVFHELATERQKAKGFLATVLEEENKEVQTQGRYL